MNNLQPRPWPAAILVTVAFFLLASLYSLVTPIFESPDELWHYPLVWRLAQTGRLPVQDSHQPQLWGQEGSQPPLYYILAALLTTPIPADNLPDLIYRNPHADIGVVKADGNANIVVHTGREAWPWTGAVLALHVARLFSVLLGTGTILTIYALGRILWPERPSFAILAMSFVAFNPMFLFISGSVNNDNLITLLASLTIWQLVGLIINSSNHEENAPMGAFIRLGLLVGLAALTKLSGLGLLGLVGLTLLVWGAARRRSWRIAVVGNGLVGLLAITIAGWWYWRNWTLYGDWSGTQNMVAMMGTRPIAPTWSQLLAELPGFLRSFWGLFGYFSVPLPAPIYWLLNLLLAAGFLGLLKSWLPGQPFSLPPRLRQTWPILAAWLVLMLLGLLQWTLRTPASQGRLLFPALAALALLWAAGWIALTPPRWYLGPILILLPLAIWVPGGVIKPAYARPTPVAPLPPSAQPLAVTFGDKIELLAYESHTAAVKPGQSLPLTLYWQGQPTHPLNYTVFIHLLDEHDLVIAQRDLFPGSGTYPTTQWTPNQAFADTYVLEIPRPTFAPGQAQFEVGLYDHTTGLRLPTSTGADSLRFGTVQIEPHPGQVPNPQALKFEDNICLVGYTIDRRLVIPGESMTLTLYWQSRAGPTANYKVFVHLVGAEENRAAQHDSEPDNGHAPTTAWTPGQMIVDEHTLTIDPETSPGAYRFVVGLYHPDTGQRLRLLYNDGRPVQTDSVTLSGVRVISPEF